jgi:hypothetical protein
VKQLLIISPHFPPVNAPDLQRVRMSLPHYRDMGWNPVVLTVAPEFQHALSEPELSTTVPADIEIHSTRAMPYALARKAGVGNIALRAWWPLFTTGLTLLKKRRFDLVFFSTTQFAALPMGPLWKKLTGTPYVIDIQDPWLTSYYFQAGARRPPGGWKYRFAHAQARLGESPVYRRASGFISVSGRYFEELEKVYPWFHTKPRAVIPFGASRRDWAMAMAGPKPPRPDSRHLRIVYTGAAGPIMPDALRCLFAGLRCLLDRAPETAKRLRFEFLGTSYAAPSEARPSVQPLAEAAGLGEFIIEKPARLGHLECLRIQAAADVLLMLGSTDLAYSPSKIYPYFISEKPVLSLAFRGSVLESILERLGCGTMVALEKGAPPSETSEAIAQVLSQIAQSPQSIQVGERNEAYFRDTYLSETLTGKQCQLLDRALSNASG